MTLKTLSVFRIAGSEIPEQDHINRVGAQYASRECQYQEIKHWGFKAFHGKQGTPEEYVTPLHNGRWLYLTLSLHKRLLPAAVVTQKTEQRARELAERTGEPLTAKETRELKEEVRLELLSKAFQKETVYQVLFDREAEQVWMDATSSSLQDDILRLLRRGLGGLPVTPALDTNNLPTHFAGWIAGTRPLPDTLRVGDSAKAIDPDDPKATITLSHEALLEPDIQSVLETRMIKQVGIESSHMQAIINDEGLLKSVKLNVEAEDSDADAAHLLTFWCLEVSQFLRALLNEVGAQSDEGRTGTARLETSTPEPATQGDAHPTPELNPEDDTPEHPDSDAEGSLSSEPDDPTDDADDTSFTGESDAVH